MKKFYPRRIIGLKLKLPSKMCNTTFNDINVNFSDVEEKIDENLKINKSKWQCEVCLNENLKDSNKCRQCISLKDDPLKLPKSESSVGTSDCEAYESNKHYGASSEDIEIRKQPQSTAVVFKNSSLKLDQQNCNIRSEKSKVNATVESEPNNVWECEVCFISNFNQELNCKHCNEKKHKEVSGKLNSQTYIDPNNLVSTSLFATMPVNPYGSDLSESNKIEIKEDGDLMEHCEVPVKRNNYLTKCACCEKSLVKLEGYFLCLCQHTVCKTCINGQIATEKLECNVYTNKKLCSRPFLLSELKIVLEKDNYERFRARLINSKETNSYIKRCYNTNCDGYYLFEKCYEQNPVEFSCNKCNLINCLKCEVIHDGLTCTQYGKLTDNGKSVDKETVEMFLNWIREGIAMPCPKCEALIEKDEGCDWVKCSFCNTEICWATRGPRWGPAGSGDITGGCGCTKEKKCTEFCNYCH